MLVFFTRYGLFLTIALYDERHITHATRIRSWLSFGLELNSTFTPDNCFNYSTLEYEEPYIIITQNTRPIWA